ncbi:MAG: hypothetical protein ABL962_20670, partial [Fimbriimonadaceae bacterium]
MLEIKAATIERVEDIREVFGSNASIRGCSCMWFLTSVSDFHAAGPQGNRALFEELLRQESVPMGLIAYQNGEPIGWCAVGPRIRYVRAIRTPTYKGRDPSEDENVWLVPCTYVRPGPSKDETVSALLEQAVALAQAHGASAIESFPFVGSKLKSSGDTQV